MTITTNPNTSISSNRSLIKEQIYGKNRVSFDRCDRLLKVNY